MYVNVVVNDGTNNGRQSSGPVPAGCTVGEAITAIVGPRDQSRLTPLVNGAHSTFNATLPSPNGINPVIIDLSPSKLQAAA